MDEVSWLGEFFSGTTEGREITGLIHYSNSQGVTLRFFKQISSQWIQPAVLLGILETGEKCTLLGPVLLPSKPNIRCNSISTGSTVVSGEIGYKYLVIGKHLDFHDTLGEASFTFSGIGSFATGLETVLQSHEAPLAFCEQTYMGKISIWRQDRSAAMLDIKEAVHSYNRLALESLSIASNAIEKEHGCYFTKRLSSEYRMIIEFKSEVSLDDACKSIQKIMDLFSLLLYSPVTAEAIKVANGNIGDRQLIVYRSLVTDDRTLNIIDSQRQYQKRLIKLPEISFPDILNRAC